MRYRRRWALMAAVLSILSLESCSSDPIISSLRPTAEDRKEQPQPPAGAISALMRVGEATRQGGDPATAVTLFRRAHALDLFQVAPLVKLGAALNDVGAYNEASEAFKDAINLDHNNVEALRGMGTALIGLNQPALAIDQFKAALAIEPDYRTFNGLAVASDHLGEHKVAQDYYQSGLKEFPRNLTLLNNLGLSQILSRDYDAAITTLVAASQEPGSTARQRQNLALAYGLAGRDSDAERVSRIDLDDRSVQSNLAYYGILRAGDDAALMQAVMGIHVPVKSAAVPAQPGVAEKPQAGAPDQGSSAETPQSKNSSTSAETTAAPQAIGSSTSAQPAAAPQASAPATEVPSFAAVVTQAPQQQAEAVPAKTTEPAAAPQHSAPATEVPSFAAVVTQAPQHQAEVALAKKLAKTAPDRTELMNVTTPAGHPITVIPIIQVTNGERPGTQAPVDPAATNEQEPGVLASPPAAIQASATPVSDSQTNNLTEASRNSSEAAHPVRIEIRPSGPAPITTGYSDLATPMPAASRQIGVLPPYIAGPVSPGPPIWYMQPKMASEYVTSGRDPITALVDYIFGPSAPEMPAMTSLRPAAGLEETSAIPTDVSGDLDARYHGRLQSVRGPHGSSSTGAGPPTLLRGAR